VASTVTYLWYSTRVVETDPNADISERRQLRKRGKPREGQATKGFRMQLKTSGDGVKTTKKKREEGRSKIKPEGKAKA